ncbi:MAG: pyridoxal 5'-phosphate synthase glutaminase subunit PdxT [bacterium JZ-2024 1]
MVEPAPLGILALQGDFAEHLHILKLAQIPAIPVRKNSDLNAISGLIIPGGESTTLRHLMKSTGIWHALLEKKKVSFPVFGTCAGIILLAEKILPNTNEEGLGYLPVTVLRNAYGRQKDSFIQKIQVNVFQGEEIEAVFIRAPILQFLAPGVQVLAESEGHPILVQYSNALGATFHPELSSTPFLHQYFWELAQKWWKDHIRVS